MQRVRYVFCLPVLGCLGCAIRVEGPPPETIAGPPVPDTAWLGLVDLREREGATTTTAGVAYVPTYVPGGAGAPGTHVVVPSGPTVSYTGELRARPIATTLEERIIATVVPTNLTGAAGTDVSGLGGVQAVSEVYPEQRCLVVFDLTAADVDLHPLREKALGIALVTGITLGVAYPFLLPWVYAPLDLPYTAAGQIKVYESGSRRFEHMAEVTTEGNLVVRGIPWGNRAYETIIQEAAEAAGSGLAAGCAQGIRCEGPAQP
ncbi:MAG: hypothetical protein JXB39_11060 [Deltaproteobacteria bacterium]|nr:hypothetical protein [Deltaproteobacteria bacterium]